MIDPDLLTRCIIDSTSEVFSTMLDLEVQFTGFASDAKTADAGLISLVGITGEWGGSGVFCCSPALASTICARMLGNEADPDNPVINEEVLDVVAEVTNMMIGNVKNGLEAATGPLAISVPTVIHGRNFQFRNSGSAHGVALSFTAGEESFEVRVALSPTAERGGGRPRIPVLGLAHI
ncbi:MAG TPA: chemotaxis protein CheX [Bryobacteraceae bacterium]|jgi:chemotaxis protein CheX|nr:chemotaxis protein CheX [Bryobacteraceae bacterium]